ncbi:M15 family metallopeptidase [Dermatobacter hominis]|uniref:M15 family metallopeptidase n=1 Tax=Dermatobacter hominis TaxID=2884263 RepID=UPI001D0FAA8D|nr:M15 family metallopeptidase [Dermatobacter hominis]UDY34835.1 D-alanyl-D-alanine carboxypeptidase family protein [Dermatobacter hominis]
MQHIPPRSSKHTAPAPRSRHRRSRSTLLVAAIAATALAVSLVPASGASADDPKGSSLAELQKQRDQVRAQKAAKASEVNGLKATDAEVSSALGALNAQVSAQQDRVEEAQRAVTQAESDKTAAEAAQVQTQKELDDLRARMKDSAVQAYVTMGSSDPMSGVGVDDVNDAVTKRTFLSVQANENTDVVERFRSKQEDLELQRAAATAAADRAAKSKAAVQDRLGDLNAAYEKQQAFAAQVDARIDRALSEADSLASVDANLSSSISSKQAEIAKALAAQRAAAESRAKAARVTLKGSGGGGGGGGGGVPPTITGSGEIVSVGGIRVHQSIAGNLQRLLSAASAAGINFSGGGYRDPSGQIAVRKSNCGTSNYAIYEMPASSCSPPTARPGQSMHERGLAIDFTQGGSTLSRGSSGFAWLKANAASYGFYNLPSEPWHWSTNGN